MKFILMPFVLLMLPIAFLFVAFDIAKEFIADEIMLSSKEENNG